MQGRSDGRSDAGPSGSVSREQYELLLEEAQAVERERVRLEGELREAAVGRARLEAQLEHARGTAERAEGQATAALESARRLESDLHGAVTQRAVTEARLEAADELRARVAALEESNNQLAFALRDSAQGYRQLVSGHGDGESGGRRWVRRPALWLAVVGLPLLVVFGVSPFVTYDRAVAAAERRAEDARRADEAARAELVEWMRLARESTDERFTDWRAAQDRVLAEVEDDLRGIAALLDEGGRRDGATAAALEELGARVRDLGARVAAPGEAPGEAPGGAPAGESDEGSLADPAPATASADAPLSGPPAPRE